MKKVDSFNYCIVIGSSRGLGAAVVEEYIKMDLYNVIGVARSKPVKISHYDKWIVSGKYRHIELDIASPKCIQVLKAVCSELPHEPICVIFNAACIEKDINSDNSINFSGVSTIDFDTTKKINQVNIEGLVNVLAAFENHLLTYGGCFVGISSLWGITPPLFLPWLAYPASKAYLNLALKCLRAAWYKRVTVISINIGKVGGSGSNLLSRWILPTYEMTAQKIVRKLSRKKISKEINYPLWHAFVYKYILRFAPDIFYLLLFRLYFKIEHLFRK
jgi:NAD(P)-dependent dehydrogenase (short-subunit alcohol dehydrogenase family)